MAKSPATVSATIEGRARRLSLGTFAALIAGAWLTAFNFQWWADKLLSDPTRTDFLFYYAGGRIVLTGRTSRLYDAGLQQAIIHGVRPDLQLDSWVAYVNPPPLAWLVAPYTALPFPVASIAWLLTVVALFGLAWWLAAPGGHAARVAYLLLALSVFPVVLSLQMLQVDAALGGLVVLAWWLLARGAPVPAGMVLALAVSIKPFVLFLVPLALLAAGWRRAFLACAATGIVLAAVSLVTVGVSGIESMLRLSQVAAAYPWSWYMTVRWVVGTGSVGLGTEVLLGGLALVAAYRVRHRDPAASLALGVLGSFLATPYLHPHDLPLLVVAAWLWLRSESGAGARVVVGLTAVGGGLVAVVGPDLFLAGELAWLGWAVVRGPLGPGLSEKSDAVGVSGPASRQGLPSART